MEYQYTYNNQTYTLNLDAQPDGTYRATIGDRHYTVTVQRQHDGEMMLLLNGKPLRANIATQKATGKHPQRHYVHWDGNTYELSAAERSSSRRQGSANTPGNLNAQMPGQVIQVLVQVGDTVEAGQTLLIMEAMKMEIRVAAPKDGVVKHLSVKAGETVDRGQILVEIGE
jgi:biotin carboxyl carrier protein